MPATTHSAELLDAEQNDARGNHEAAVNALARGTRAGDIACMTRLGNRLLVGDRAPLLAAEGARFLHDAAHRGGAEAAARMAALTALGLYTRQNWNEALTWLVSAAGQGWPQARAQLLALAGRESTPAQPAGPGEWAALAQGIDFSPWQTPAAVRTLSADPVVRVLEKFVPLPVCQWMIERSLPCLTRAKVYDPVNQRDVVGNTRTNSVANFNLGQIEFTDVLLQARMSDACGVPIGHMEAPAVLHYSVGEEASDHFDFVDPKTADYEQEIARNGQRVLTCLIYLNDDYEGGETSFPSLGISHKGRRGEALYFVNALSDMSPDLRMLHSGRSPTQGEKWIVSQFMRSRATLAPVPLRTAYQARPADR